MEERLFILVYYIYILALYVLIFVFSTLTVSFSSVSSPIYIYLFSYYFLQDMQVHIELSSFICTDVQITVICVLTGMNFWLKE